MSALRVCCALMLAPALVVAQPGPAPARRSGRDVPPPASEPVPTADVETHKVQRGDTLWDLSARYLNSPWYWPKVWSYNPEIGNPHWIYPGNVVRLRPPGREGAPAAAGPDEESEPAPELAGLSRADLAKAARVPVALLVQLERGQTVPLPGKVAIRIAAVFGMRGDALFNLEDQS